MTTCKDVFYKKNEEPLEFCRVSYIFTDRIGWRQMLKRRDILSKRRNSRDFDRKKRIYQKESEEDEARSKKNMYLTCKDNSTVFKLQG